MMALLLSATPASAHTGLAGGFGAGFAHPWNGADHMLAMIAVGIWGAILGRPLIYLLPVVFPLVMVVGAELAMFGMTMPPVEIGVALSVTALGLCIACGFRAPTWMACAIVGCFGLLHGVAHGAELPTATDPLGYASGFVLATGSLHLLGIGLGRFDRRILRLAGGAICLAGCWFLSALILVASLHFVTPDHLE